MLPGNSPVMSVRSKSGSRFYTFLNPEITIMIHTASVSNPNTIMTLPGTKTELSLKDMVF